MGLTELVFLLDKSGSMGGLEEDTIGGYNALLADQKKLEGRCRVTTVLFDHGYHLLHDRVDLAAVQPLTRAEYQVGGSTALLDAMGLTIQRIKAEQEPTADGDAALQVMFVIITDGLENSSREFSVERVKALVEEAKDKHGWEFVFLGANMDAIATAGQYGIGADRAQSFHADPRGIALNFAVMSETVAAYRQTGQVQGDWRRKIARDYKQRSPRP